METSISSPLSTQAAKATPVAAASAAMPIPVFSKVEAECFMLLE